MRNLCWTTSQLPISSYNYSALRDRLKKQGIEICLNTIIGRARKLGYDQPSKEKQTHDRETLIASPGAFIQHGGSHHVPSSFAKEESTLINCLSDYRRKILVADSFPPETTRAHIQATQTSTQTYGAPLQFAVLRRLAARLPFRPGKRQLLAQACPADRRLR